MARNKYPEKTIAHILEVSTALFINKGYDKTTIQDIIDALQMSKGAIYHHFRSKEEILQAVIKQRNAYAKELLITLIHTTNAKNGREKLMHILEATILDKKNHSIDPILVSQIQDPQFLVAGMHSAISEDAPLIAEVFEEGIKDGSLSCQAPTICAELFLLLINIWINPTMFERSIEETRERLSFLQQTMKTLGADIITDTLLEKIIAGYQSMNAFD